MQILYAKLPQPWSKRKEEKEEEGADFFSSTEQQTVPILTVLH